MQHPPRRPIRILNAIKSLNRGGIETGLLRILEQIDRDQFQLDYLVHVQHPCDLEQDVKNLGAKVIRPRCEPVHMFWYQNEFRRVLKENPPYDVVHSHMYDVSAFILGLAKRNGIPLRIAHSHSDSRRDPSHGSMRRSLRPLVRASLQAFATDRLACDYESGVSLFGTNFMTKPSDRILHAGIDLSTYADQQPNGLLRTAILGNESSLVIGHVGRFTAAKNHQFLIHVVQACKQYVPDVKCVLVGVGPLQPSIQAQISLLGLEDHFVFTGLRSDIPEILTSAFDVFVFPSLYEGLPLALVEAQSAGLPCVISDNITSEAQIVPSLTKRLSLDAPPDTWAQAVLSLSKHGRKRKEALSHIQRTDFNIEVCVETLSKLYSRYSDDQ